MKIVNRCIDFQLIRQIELFQNVSSESLQQCYDEFCSYDLEPGEVLLSPFNHNQHLYIVTKGYLQVYLGSLDNPVVGTLSIGDCVGEISAIDQSPPSAYVVAKEPASVISLHRDVLMSMFEQAAQVTKNMLKLLCARVRTANRLILDSEQIAHIDKLTGSFNRRWLEHVFEREQKRCVLSASPLSMLIFDVDYFKAYNDQYGHLAGDYALCMVANTVRSQLRPKDSLVRFGGEEFVIVLPELDLQESWAIGERLRKSAEQVSVFYSPLGALPGVTVSIGLAQMAAGEKLESLLSRADRALYRAKLAGRNCLASD